MKKTGSLISHLCLCSPLPQSLSSLLSPSFFPIPISLCASGIVSSSVPPSLHFHSFIYSNHLLCVHCFPCSHWLCMAAVSLPATVVTGRWVFARVFACVHTVYVCISQHVCIFNCIYVTMCLWVSACTRLFLHNYVSMHAYPSDSHVYVCVI